MAHPLVADSVSNREHEQSQYAASSRRTTVQDTDPPFPLIRASQYIEQLRNPDTYGNSACLANQIQYFALQSAKEIKHSPEKYRLVLSIDLLPLPPET